MGAASQTDISILISGEAGQGLQKLEILLLDVFKNAGYFVYSYSEFMSRIRGGNNSTQVRIASKPVNSYRRGIDIFVPLHINALERFKERVTVNTLILGDFDLIPEEFFKKGFKILNVPLVQLSKDAGGLITLNMVVLGVLAAMMGIDPGFVKTRLEHSFSRSDSQRKQKSIEAVLIGYDSGAQLRNQAQGLLPAVRISEEVKNNLVMSGVDAIGIGGLAGGCNFVSSYPMSPSTGVLVFFARHAQDFGVVVEQAEDEISAVNMALGAWYAGGRGFVTTSGGGFALMVEGLSLAGAIESPLVIHIGQRPGPATGLPTRTEQADLEHALYSGHGEFPRAILAPGSIQEGLTLTRQAFMLADKYQVPVIILTDQHYLDSNFCIAPPDIKLIEPEKYVIETKEDYRRYQFTSDGVSPRGIPGFGKGIVCADSDEHDEGGYITEDALMRSSMVEKRLNKLKGLASAAVPPTLTGPQSFNHLVVGWGSTFNVVREALEAIDRDDVAFLHFSQVYPLPAETSEILSRARNRIIIENNATSQFAKLIKLETGIDFDERILKYDGMPFMLEDVIEDLERALKGKNSG